MGMDASGQRGGRPGNTAAVTWAVVGVVALGTVLAVWVRRAGSQPDSVFGDVGGIAVLGASLVAVVAASVSRGARLAARRVLGVVTIVLALCTEVLALEHFARTHGSADTAFGWILSAGAVAMLAAAIGVLRGRRG